MKRLSWPGVVVVAGSTIVSWIAGSPVMSPIGHTRAATGPNAAANSSASVADVMAAMHLHDWSPKPPTRVRTERDIFVFKRRAPKPVAAPASPFLEAGGAHQPSLVLFKLIGFAEDPGPAGATRTAIISGQGQLYLVKAGETVASIYRVGTMSSDSVELLDSTGGATVRLVFK